MESFKRVELKTVLITGANSGIGFATVQRFLYNDYIVFAHYHKSKSALESLQNEQLYTLQADFRDAESVDALFDSCINFGKSIDILVNNAGLYFASESIEDLGLDAIDAMMQVNMKAPFILSQRAFKMMKEKRWGRIINISSIGVKYGGSPGSMHYTMSKAALESMTFSFSRAGASDNILVNAIRVGLTDTALHRGNPNKDMSKRIKMIPLNRMAKPEEIAEYIYFLASEKSNFTTGSILTVAGGE